MLIFMPGLLVSAIKNKWKSLKKDYKAITILRNEGGVFWDPTLGTVKGADDGWWDTMAQECKETKRFKNRGCEHIELLDRLWKDAAKGKKVRIATGMHGANDEGEVKLEAAACHSDSLRRHGQLGGLLRPPSKWAPIVCPLRHPWTRVRGSDVRGLVGGCKSSLDRKAPVIDEEMMNEQIMFENWAEKQRRCQSSSTAADVDVPIGDFVAALEAVEPKLSQEQFNRAYIQLGTNKYLRRAFIALTADRRRDFAWGCGKPL
ncbi:hypothetical protein CJ030_MR2G000930 [Morella rubra]|uniref:Myb/SANT-like domain-containing protein n=1 Tax=Morella rubra TaxID=262757 RepID=A0A6A1WKQ0_9ROSI|nr:hypothetical protein CJ030_MR2G000930 [Morella rubra]